MTAALSCDNELYVWGGRPEEREKIAALKRREGEEVALVEVGSGMGMINEGGRDGGLRGEVEERDVAARLKGGEDEETSEEGKEEDKEDEGEEEEEGILDVALGESHILALTTRGRVYAVGEGKWGQLGTGKRKFEKEWMHVPVQLDGLEQQQDRGSRCMANNMMMMTTEGHETENANGDPGEERTIDTGKDSGSSRGYPAGKKRIVGVECGPWSSFLLVSSDSGDEEGSPGGEGWERGRICRVEGG